MWKKFLFGLAIIVINLLFVILIGETYARLKHGDVLAFQATESVYRRPDFSLHHSLIPGAQGVSISREWSVPYSINSMGLRDREYFAERVPGTFRILVLGDSFVEGYGVERDDTFNKVLERELNGLSDGAKYEVVNGGIASYSPLLEYLFLVDAGLELKPDMVMLFYDFGDLRDDHEYEMTTFFGADGIPEKCVPYKRIRAYGQSSIERFLVRHCRFYVYIENRVNKALFKKRMGNLSEEQMDVERYIAYRAGRENDVRKLWVTNKKYLSMIHALLKDKGIDLVVVSYPYAIGVSGEEWAEGRVLDGFETGVVYGEPDVVRYLDEFCGEEHIPFLNLYDDFLKSEEFPLYYAFDGHFTKKGHKLVATAMLRELMNLQEEKAVNPEGAVQ